MYIYHACTLNPSSANTPNNILSNFFRTISILSFYPSSFSILGFKAKKVLSLSFRRGQIFLYPMNCMDNILTNIHQLEKDKEKTPTDV